MRDSFFPAPTVIAHEGDTDRSAQSETGDHLLLHYWIDEHTPIDLMIRKTLCTHAVPLTVHIDGGKELHRIGIYLEKSVKPSAITKTNGTAT